MKPVDLTRTKKSLSGYAWYCKLSARDRFLIHARPGARPSDCIEWGGALNSNGYGTFRVDGKQIAAHRYLFVLNGGILTKDKPWVLHSCDNSRCVNPMHLRAGDLKDNVADFLERGNPASEKGESSSRHKLTELDVMEMRYGYMAGFSISSFSIKHEISYQSARDAIRGKNWSHLAPLQGPVNKRTS